MSAPSRRSRPQLRDAADIRPQHGRHRDGSVGALEVLEDGHQRATDGEPGAVERMHELVASLRGLEAGLHAARLERLAVRTRADLAVRVLRRQPDLEVERLRRAESEVAGGELDDAVRQL